MRITFRIHEDALAKLRERAEQFEYELGERIDRRLDAFGVDTTEAMRENHGKDAHDIQRYVNRTWDLTESIGFTLEPPQEFNGAVVHRLEVFAAAPYAFDVEEGIPGRSRPYPFFWVEIYNEERRQQVLAGLQQDLDGAIAAVAE